jgi:hypothetical protein
MNRQIAWGYADREPEETSLKVAKKYPSKQTFPCPKCEKVD